MPPPASSSGFNGFSNEPLHPWLRAAILYFFPPLAMHLALGRWPALAFDDSWFGKCFAAFAWAERHADRWPTLALAVFLGGFVGLLVAMTKLARADAHRVVAK